MAMTCHHRLIPFFYATHLDPVLYLGHLSGELQRLNMQTKDEQ